MEVVEPASKGGDEASSTIVEVKPGLTAGGLVEVTPTGKGALEAGDEVVVGTADGTPTSTPDDADPSRG